MPNEKIMPRIRGVESCWGCSNSGSDSSLLIDSNSRSDAKYKVNSTIIVGGVSAAQAQKEM